MVVQGFPPMYSHMISALGGWSQGRGGERSTARSGRGLGGMRAKHTGVTSLRSNALPVESCLGSCGGPKGGGGFLWARYPCSTLAFL